VGLSRAGHYVKYFHEHYFAFMQSDEYSFWR
jgi:hypothetical protein